jgi:putative Mg2+ transporter-C (MgtC) family protein
MLVALGAAVFIMTPLLAGFGDNEISRAIQGLVAGIGFLGAGAIVKGKPGEEIEGLTTAASIWMTAAIGMTAGMGRASTAIVSTVLALIVLTMLFHAVDWLHANQAGRTSEGPGPTPKKDGDNGAA